MPIDPETVALFRYTVIAEAANPRLRPRERGHLVRVLAQRTHRHPDGSWARVSRNTLDRWLRAYRERGLAGLRPETRSDNGAVRRHPELSMKRGRVSSWTRPITGPGSGEVDAHLSIASSWEDQVGWERPAGPSLGGVVYATRARAWDLAGVNGRFVTHMCQVASASLRATSTRATFLPRCLPRRAAVRS